MIIWVNFLAAGSGSAFPIRIRIKESQINADPDPQHWVNPKYGGVCNKNGREEFVANVENEETWKKIHRTKDCWDFGILLWLNLIINNYIMREI